MNRGHESREAGFVSLFTVIFFMMLISIITIGFLRIMSIEQRQSLDNDLTASALAAAESGVEDAKRAILKYIQMPDGAEKTTLGNALNSNDCDALQNNSTAQSIGISSTGSVTGSANLNQFYTCLTVNMDSPDYISSSTAGASEYIPLVPADGETFDRVRISWHLVSDTVGTDGDGHPERYATSTLLPQVVSSNPNNSWTDRGYPAYMRVQLFGYPNGSFNRDNVDDRTRAAVLIPSVAGSTESTPISMDVADPLPHDFDTTKSPVQSVQCKGTGTPPNVAVGTYACTALIELPSDPGLRGNNNHYFLRTTPLYGATHYKVELINSGSGVVNFSEVQPIVDVTGRAADVFRRVQSRVRLGSFADLPEYAAETADTICKNMEVTDGSYFNPNNCP